MTRHTRRLVAPLVLLGALLSGLPFSATAQYFGRNKVQYEKFDFRICGRRTSTSTTTRPSRPPRPMPAAWRSAGTRGTPTPSTTRFDRKPIVLYADQPDFQQTNVVGESTRTRARAASRRLRDRVVLPLHRLYAENDHVLGHEMVHVFQYDIAEPEPGGLQRAERAAALAGRRHGRVLLARPRRSAHRDVAARRRASATTCRRSTS